MFNQRLLDELGNHAPQDLLANFVIGYTALATACSMLTLKLFQKTETKLSVCTVGATEESS